MFSFIIIKKHLPAPPNLAPPPSLKLQNSGGSAGFSLQGLPCVAGAALITWTGRNGCIFPARPGSDHYVCQLNSAGAAPAPLFLLLERHCCAAACQICMFAQLPLKCSGMQNCWDAPTWPRPEPRSQVLVLKRPLGPPGSWILEFRVNSSSRGENK